MNTKIIGWIVFASSLLLYTITLEPTTSFWDCSEFILSAAKLEINHPAGAPLFMLIGRLFTLLAFGNPERIAWIINFMSGFFSALTIFFMYHCLVLIVKKIYDNKFLIIGSAALGAITFAVTDSFWFSAVEGEVYALSMFFLILSFWAILKWEQDYEKPGNEKWILFLGLITGLGIGVHLLNLLVLPSVVLTMGFKKYGFSIKKTILFFGLGIILLLSVLYFLTPLALKLMAFLDFQFVNNLNLPKHSGALTGIVVIFSLLTFLYFYFKNKNAEKLVLAVLTVLLFYAGFSIYSVNIIRSSSNPPINFGRPDNIYSLINYLNREQYPKRPLVYGENYNSPITEVQERYSKEYLKGKYEIINLSPVYEFDKNSTSFFPRMYNREERQKQAYNSWIKIKGKRVSVMQGGKQQTITIPSFTDHLKFFTGYQFGYMHLRYFMWNFVGRQNDRQGRGGMLEGNWLSGIGIVDNLHLGVQDKLPEWMKNNKARNTYFFIPLILGLTGMFFHFKKDRSSFFIVLALFVMGGLGLTIYINEIPITPRERDYVFVGSFLAFSIWIGISLLVIASKTTKLLKGKIGLVAVFIVLFLSCPGLMAYQNFDDHNRSDRFAARDLAVNILNSCPENAILFTSGDNDTYPLLYCQEVEGIRTDVRIVIMPFLAANWFIDGLRDPKYEDAGLNMILPQAKYDFGKFDFIPVVNKIKRDTSWEEALAFLKSDNVNSKVKMNSGEDLDFLPADKFSIHIKQNEVTSQVNISLSEKQFLYKNELAMWDIISSNVSERPVCFVSKMEAGKYGLGENLRCEGFVYRIVPEKMKQKDIFSIGNCDTEKTYNFLKNEMKWGNVAHPSVYVDWNTITNLNVFQIRNVFNEVASKLMLKDEKSKAIELLKICTEQLPLSKLPYDIFAIRQMELMIDAGMLNEGGVWFNELENGISQTLGFYQSLTEKQKLLLREEIQRELYYLNQLVTISSKMEKPEKKKELEMKLENYMGMIRS